MGAAIKIDELVPTTMPNSIGRAKLATAAPPAMAMGNSAKKVVNDVKTVRVSVEVMLSLSVRRQP